MWNLRGIHAETHQAQAWMGVEFKGAENNNSWSSSSVHARKRISLCPNPAYRVVPHCCTIIHWCYLSSAYGTDMLESNTPSADLISGSFLCFLNQTLTLGKATWGTFCPSPKNLIVSRGWTEYRKILSPPLDSVAVKSFIFSSLKDGFLFPLLTIDDDIWLDILVYVEKQLSGLSDMASMRGL